MDAETLPQFMQPQWFLPLFGAMWIGINALLSILGGWFTLAKRFRAESEPTGDQFRFVSGSMGIRYFPVNYRNCLFVIVSSTGVHISVLFLFRVMSPPLFIPWSDVESVEEHTFLFSHTMLMRVRGAWAAISLRGEVGQRIHEVYKGACRPAL